MPTIPIPSVNLIPGVGWVHKHIATRQLKHVKKIQKYLSAADATFKKCEEFLTSDQRDKYLERTRHFQTELGNIERGSQSTIGAIATISKASGVRKEARWFSATFINSAELARGSEMLRRTQAEMDRELEELKAKEAARQQPRSQLPSESALRNSQSLTLTFEHLGESDATTIPDASDPAQQSQVAESSKGSSPVEERHETEHSGYTATVPDLRSTITRHSAGSVQDFISQHQSQGQHEDGELKGSSLNAYNVEQLGSAPPNQSRVA
ncbi:hypothetical protein JB92DRAFT_2963458 [Gautieria morchelliformis]|nr:hypothetical protein JB92DRAFT_2963458 [Gautieria morchelliformis]